MEFVAAALLAALVKKLVDFGKLVTDGDWKGVLTQLVAWVAGTVSVWLAAASPWGDAISVGNVAASSLGVIGILIAGLLIGSAGSVLYDYAPSKIQVGA